MKHLKTALPTAILGLFFCLALAGCEQPDNFTVKSWFKDESTFVIVSRGKPKPDQTESLKRKYQSERAALLVAQNEMVSKLEGYTIVGEKVTDTRYDSNQNCFLTYEVTVRKK